MELAAYFCYFAGDCCNNFYKRILNEDMCQIFTLVQNSHEWHDARKYRITGYRYQIFTYNGAVWEMKANKYFWPKTFTNKFVRHGLRYENAARAGFVKNTGMMVTECGMITFPQNKWLRLSPDGIVLEGNDKPVALLEINVFLLVKCFSSCFSD